MLVKIHANRVAHCQQLAQEFQYYVAKTNSLRKVFLSIKGIYYQAELFGQPITWLVPYQFSQKVHSYFLAVCLQDISM